MGNRHPPSNVLPEVHPKSVNSKIQGRDVGRHGLFFFFSIRRFSVGFQKF